MAKTPLIGVTACLSQVGLHPFHITGDKYVRAASLAGLPLIIPALAERLDQAALLQTLDGLVFTGSPSNVEPHHYNGPASESGTLHDPERDRTTLPLLKAAVEVGIPVLGICRGFQEMNVAFGGTLHQKVQEVDGLMDHREDKTASIEEQYAYRHSVRVEPGGALAGFGLPAEFEVNSLHGQGIDRLGAHLRVEARAPDGLIEAISVVSAKTFAVGVQWHPEWQVHQHPQYLALFQAFAKACRERAQRH